ncbi:MAG: hypothetical protein WCI18_03920 [Pseudomonadota bacterium]
MDWSKIKIPTGSQVLKSHHFMFMVKGRSFEFEINEYSDSRFMGYGQLSNDESQQLKPVNGATLEGCLQSLIDAANLRP